MRVVKDPEVIKIDSSDSENEEENVTIHQKQKNSYVGGTATTNNTKPSVASAPLVCRVCLSADVKLYNLYECKMDETFGDFTGMPIFQLDGLPHHLCYLCIALLRKSAEFRDKCLSTHFYLRNIYMRTLQLTDRDIRLIDKKKFALPLKETLPLTIDYCDKTNMNVERELSDNEDFHAEYLDDTDIDLEPNPRTLPELVDIPKKANKYFLVINEKGGIDVSSDVEAHANEDAANNMSLDNITETLTDDDDVMHQQRIDAVTDEQPIDDKTNKIPIDNEKNKKLINNKKKVTKKNKAKRKEELDNFCVTYNVRIVQGLDVELEEMQRIRNSEKFKNSKLKCELCCKIFKSATSHVDHNKRHNLYGKFECEICRLRYDSMQELCVHLGRIHQGVRFKCVSCGFICKSKCTVIYHFESHKEKVMKTYDCTDCPKKFGRSALLNLHVRKYHTERQCSQCGEIFAGTKALLDHNTTVHNQPHKCSSCNMVFETSQALDQHQCTHSSCQTCETGFDSGIQMKEHYVEIHQTRKCEKCEFTCEYFRTLRQHYISEHKDTKPPSFKRHVYVCVCKICDKSVNSLSYKAHLLSHSSERPHQCRFCGKTFLRQKYLKKHENKHTGERPHKCPECPATFGTHMEKTEHKKTVHLKEQYKCRVCDRRYASLSNLKMHEVNHSYGEYYQCDLCKKKFSLKHTLERHLANHGNKTKNIYKLAHRCNLCPARFRRQHWVEKHKAMVHNVRETYQCDKCGKIFQIKTSLTNHLKKQHLDEKFKCTLCPKEYVVKTNLREHMNQHTGAKPFQCSLCPKTFSRHWMRYEHKLRDHLKKPIKKRSRPARQGTDFDDE